MDHADLCAGEDELIPLKISVPANLIQRLESLAEEAGMLVGEYAGLLLAGEVRVNQVIESEEINDGRS